MTAKLAMDDFERQRIQEILLAAIAGDWERFRFLSDEPFSNEAGMLEQFNDSRVKMAPDIAGWENRAGVDEISDGSRLVLVVLENKDSEEPEIVLTVHSRAGKIAIWNFYERLELSGL